MLLPCETAAPGTRTGKTGTSTPISISINAVINVARYTYIEMDAMWDSSNSTISIDTFNRTGDIDGFPAGVLTVPSLKPAARPASRLSPAGKVLPEAPLCPKEAPLICGSIYTLVLYNTKTIWAVTKAA